MHPQFGRDVVADDLPFRRRFGLPGGRGRLGLPLSEHGVTDDGLHGQLAPSTSGPAGRTRQIAAVDVTRPIATIVVGDLDRSVSRSTRASERPSHTEQRRSTVRVPASMPEGSEGQIVPDESAASAVWTKTRTPCPIARSSMSNVDWWMSIDVGVAGLADAEPEHRAGHLLEVEGEVLAAHADLGLGDPVRAQGGGRGAGDDRGGHAGR